MMVPLPPPAPGLPGAGGGSFTGAGGLSAGGELPAATAGMPSVPLEPVPQPLPPPSGDPAILEITPAANTLSQYDMLTVTVRLETPFLNPHDADDISIDLVGITPAGNPVRMPGFYRSGSSGDSTWEIRFTPQHIGRYVYGIEVRHGAAGAINMARYGDLPLDVSASPQDGFLHIPTSTYFNLEFDSGERFRGVGENYGWENEFFTFDTMLPRLAEHKVNFIRTWEGPGRYHLQHGLPLPGINEAVATKIDSVLELAQSLGIYIMSAFDVPIYFNTTPDYWNGAIRWFDNPYSTNQGGPCGSPGEFFTNETARRHYKNKIRYTVARWAAFPHLAVFEF